MSAPNPHQPFPDPTQPSPESIPARPVCFMFGLEILAVTFEEAADLLGDKAASGLRPAQVVVTPNVDHLVRLDRASAGFRALYASADAIFADGMPLVWASRMLGDTPLPERVTGSDLFVSLAQRCAASGLPVFILGGMPGQEAGLTAELAARFPGLKAVVFSPSMQFDPVGAEGEEALRRIAQAAPAIVFVCLGMPKQEVWAMTHRHAIQASLVMCVGAAMEFALGHKRRAPAWMQRSGLEWLWRLVSEPRRLARRYLVSSLRFVRLLRAERQRRRSAGH